MINEKNRARELIEFYGYGEDDPIVIFENPSYDTAFVGVIKIGNNILAVYDYEEMVNYLVENEGMLVEEAIDFIDWNYSYRQEGEPIILYGMK